MNGLSLAERRAPSLKAVRACWASALRERPDGLSRRTVAAAVAARHSVTAKIRLPRRAALRFGSALATHARTPFRADTLLVTAAAVQERTPTPHHCLNASPL